jgi:predicted alpha/beta-hydrolase family hydrolase
MRGWASRLSSLGPIVAFDYPYMQSGRKMPDPLSQLVAAHRHAVEEARARHPGKVVLMGKSMGGRIGCHVALEDPAIDRLVCFGYPLLSPGKRPTTRDQVLFDLRVPILFLQGSRDPLCPLEQLERVRANMQARSELHVVHGGDHSLVVAKSTLRASGQTQIDVDQGVLGAIAKFLGDSV